MFQEYAAASWGADPKDEQKWCAGLLVSYSASRLFNAIQVMNLGNNRTQWHNTCQRAVLDTARNAGLRVEPPGPVQTRRVKPEPDNSVIYTVVRRGDGRA